ncbi:MAG: hypothetical protein Q4G66_09110 [bacterium]|nr:hypothetical protein [bacterium]
MQRYNNGTTLQIGERAQGQSALNARNAQEAKRIAPQQAKKPA